MGAPPDSDGRAIQGYQPVHRVAQSYLGPLWIAMDTRAGAARQLRLLRRLYLPSDAPEAARRAILAVGKQALRLKDPNVLGVVDVLEQDGLIGIGYEHLEAEPLRSLQSWANLRCLSFPVGVSLRIIIDLLRGVEATHRTYGGDAPAVFGGLSPDSVLVSRDGTTRLCDPLVAGCASLLEAIGFSTAKLAYAAPEQIHAVAPLTPSCDVFTCGAMLWELLATRRLLAGSRPAIERKLLEHDLPSLRAHLGSGEAVSPALVDLVEKSLAADPAQRPHSAAELGERLAAAGHGVATLAEVAHFVGKLSGQRFDRRTAAVRSKSLPQLDTAIEWPIEVATKPGARRRGARGAKAPSSQVATPRRADLFGTPATPPATPLAAQRPTNSAAGSPPGRASPAAAAATFAAPSPFAAAPSPFAASPSVPSPPARPVAPVPPPMAPVAAPVAPPALPFGALDTPFSPAAVPVAPLGSMPPVMPRARPTATALDRTIAGLGAPARSPGAMPPLAEHGASEVDDPPTLVDPFPPDASDASGRADAPSPAHAEGAPGWVKHWGDATRGGAANARGLFALPGAPRRAWLWPLVGAGVLPLAVFALWLWDGGASPAPDGAGAATPVPATVPAPSPASGAPSSAATPAHAPRPAQVTQPNPNAVALDPAAANDAAREQGASEIAPEAVAPAPNDADSPETDFSSPTLADDQLVELFSLERRSELPTCLERLGESASEYSGNDPVQSIHQLKAARRELMRGNDTAAHGLLCGAVAHDPTHVAAQQTLAELALQLGDPTQAKAAIERAIALSPENPTLLTLLGDALALLGDIAGSRATWLSTMPPQGTEAERTRRLASSYRLMGDRAIKSSSFGQARLYYRRALILTAGGYGSSLGLSEALTGLRHMRAGLAWLERAARAFPKDSRVQVLFGDALYETGQTEAARVAWQAALDARPSHRGAARRLSQTRP